MRTVVLVLACLLYQGSGRRARSAAAFNPSMSNPTSTQVHSTSNRRARDIPLMQDASTPEAEVPEKKFDVREMAGVTEPLGFFDPFGYSIGTPEKKVLFYREVELKHGRVAMLASLGFLVAEQFHPLFGGKNDVPSLVAFQNTPLQEFWGTVLFFIAIFEVFSIFTFESPGNGLWCMKVDHEPGNLGFDPLGLKPLDPEDRKIMQTKELNNGRLAMIAVLGMVYQEVANPGQKLF